MKVNPFIGEKFMSDKIIDLQSVLEKNSSLDSYGQGYLGNSDSEIDLFRHKLKRLACDNRLIGSGNIDDGFDDIGDDGFDDIDDDFEILDFGE